MDGDIDEFGGSDLVVDDLLPVGRCGTSTGARCDRHSVARQGELAREDLETNWRRIADPLLVTLRPPRPTTNFQVGWNRLDRSLPELS